MLLICDMAVEKRTLKILIVLIFYLNFNKFIFYTFLTLLFRQLFCLPISTILCLPLKSHNSCLFLVLSHCDGIE